MNIFTDIGLLGLGAILGVLLCVWLIYRSHENFRKMRDLGLRAELVFGAFSWSLITPTKGKQ